MDSSINDEKWTAAIEGLRNELNSYKQLLDAVSEEYKKYSTELSDLKVALKDHQAAVESRVERISDVLVTNIAHLRAIVDNISILNDRIAECESFALNHNHEYLSALNHVDNIKKEIDTSEKQLKDQVNQVSGEVNTLKKNVAKELNALKEHDDVQSKYHWKLGVIVTVVGMALALVLRVGSVQELITSLFDWLSR